jgi:hypothetical protein
MSKKLVRELPKKMAKAPDAMDVMTRLIKAAETLLTLRGFRYGKTKDITADVRVRNYYIIGDRTDSNWSLSVDRDKPFSKKRFVGTPIYVDAGWSRDNPRTYFNYTGAKKALKVLEAEIPLELLSEV